MGYLYLVVVVDFKRVKVGYWSGSKCLLRNRYVTPYGNDIAIHVYEHDDPLTLEKLFKRQFHTKRAVCELYQREYLQEYLEYMDQISKMSPIDASNLLDGGRDDYSKQIEEFTNQFEDIEFRFKYINSNQSHVIQDQLSYFNNDKDTFKTIGVMKIRHVLDLIFRCYISRLLLEKIFNDDNITLDTKVVLPRTFWKKGIIEFIRDISEDDFVWMNSIEDRRPNKYESKEAYLNRKCPFSWINALLKKSCNVMFVRTGSNNYKREAYESRKLILAISPLTSILYNGQVGTRRQSTDIAGGSAGERKEGGTQGKST